ncbi:MAG: type II secretion system major pseudopilin GspG [Gammaproteobacteria bacterium]|nr:type II secretion system major pseudopilin GspG [Gammaproteobacteria bacterium]
MKRTAYLRIAPPRGRSAGFTLIEIMVVVVILGILAAVIVPRVLDRPDTARLVKAKQDLRTLESALNLYRLDNYVYPSTEQGLEALVEEPTGEPEARNWQPGGYIDRLPVDPWQRPYLYLNPGQHGDFDVYTLGADGVPGGEGVNADLGNWKLD